MVRSRMESWIMLYGYENPYKDLSVCMVYTEFVSKVHTYIPDSFTLQVKLF